MRRHHNNPSSEATALARDLSAGRIMPATIERLLASRRDALSDAIYFKRPDPQIASLQAQVADLEAVLAGATAPPEGPAARRERLEQAAFQFEGTIVRLNNQASALARQIETLEYDYHESVRMRDPAHVIERLRGEIAAQRAEHTAISMDLDAAQRQLTTMAAAAHAEVGPAGPVPMAPRSAEAAAAQDRAAVELRQAQVWLASLRSELANPIYRRDHEFLQRVQCEIREAEEDVDRLQERVRRNPGRNAVSNPSRKKKKAYIESARLDIASGRLTSRDVSRRVERYRRILAETIENDPGAPGRIAALTRHIEALEWLLRSLEKAGS